MEHRSLELVQGCRRKAVSQGMEGEKEMKEKLMGGGCNVEQWSAAL